MKLTFVWAAPVGSVSNPGWKSAVKVKGVVVAEDQSEFVVEQFLLWKNDRVEKSRNDLNKSKYNKAMYFASIS